MKRLATVCASLVIGHAIAAVPQLSRYAVPPAWADGAGLNQAALISSVLPSVVNISVNKKVAGQGSDGGGGNTEVKRFVGSGFIIEASGLVMTNYHVVQDALDIMVTLSDGTRLPGKAENASRLADLALVKIEPPRPLQAIRWGEGVHVGDEVFAAGDPFGIGTSVSAGIVSGLNRDMRRQPNLPRAINSQRLSTRPRPRHKQLVKLTVPGGAGVIIGSGYATHVASASQIARFIPVIADQVDSAP